MTTVDFLVVDHRGADLLVSPLSVLGISQLIHITDEHSDGDGADVVDRDKVGCSLSADV